MICCFLTLLFHTPHTPIQAGTQAQDRQRAIDRVVQPLMRNRLALPLLILIAQQRTRYLVAKAGFYLPFVLTFHPPFSSLVYHSDMPLGLLSELYDQCQNTLVLFYDFVARHIETVHWVDPMPSVEVCFLASH